jgi:Ran GTPase-activating protein (RanGAP) involved in mRNA processing and transport
MVSLKAAFCRIQRGSAECLRNLLHHPCLIRRLDLGFATGSFKASQVVTLCGGITAASPLEELRLAGIRLDRFAVDAIVGACRRARKLHTLDLFACNIPPELMVPLADGLVFSAALHTLNLRSNNGGPAGAAAIADMVKRAPRIRNVNLANNRMGRGGALTVSMRYQGTAEELLACFNPPGPGHVPVVHGTET